MIDLDKESLEAVKAILCRLVPDCEVRVYGSRVKGNARKYSDLDLEIVGKGRLPMGRIDALKEAFAMSDLPIMVDVVDQHGISPEFRKVIALASDVIQEPNQA